MSKAVLIIDMPENCPACQLYDEFEGFCPAECRDVIPAERRKKERPYWCPLKEVLNEYDVQVGHVETVRLKEKEN